MTSTILIAAIIGLVKWKKVKKINHLFIVFVYCSAINETLSYISTYLFKNNAVNSNIYLLISAIVLLFQFNNWYTFKYKKKSVYFITLILLSIWFYEFFLITQIWKFSSYFRIISAFIIVLLSLRTISLLINSNQLTLIMNSTFIICIALILFYTVKILLEIFFIYALPINNFLGNSFYRLIFNILILTNIMYALAIIFMPLKPKYILQQLETT